MSLRYNVMDVNLLSSIIYSSVSPFLFYNDFNCICSHAEETLLKSRSFLVLDNADSDCTKNLKILSRLSVSDLSKASRMDSYFPLNYLQVQYGH